MEIKSDNEELPEIQSTQIGITEEAGGEFLPKMRRAGWTNLAAVPQPNLLAVLEGLDGREPTLAFAAPCAQEEGYGLHQRVQGRAFRHS